MTEIIRGLHQPPGQIAFQINVLRNHCVRKQNRRNAQNIHAATLGSAFMDMAKYRLTTLTSAYRHRGIFIPAPTENRQCAAKNSATPYKTDWARRSDGTKTSPPPQKQHRRSFSDLTFIPFQCEKPPHGPACSLQPDQCPRPPQPRRKYTPRPCRRRCAAFQKPAAPCPPRCFPCR